MTSHLTNLLGTGSSVLYLSMVDQDDKAKSAMITWPRYEIN